jgi:hypothetical protein
MRPQETGLNLPAASLEFRARGDQGNARASQDNAAGNNWSNMTSKQRRMYRAAKRAAKRGAV